MIRFGLSFGVCACVAGSLAMRASVLAAPVEPPAKPPPATAPAPAPADKPKSPATLPEAREIINRHVKEIGGEETLRSKKSLHIKSRVTIPSRNGGSDLEIFQAPPDKLVVKSVQPFGTTRAGFNGATGWIVDAHSGARLADASQLPELRERADFLSVLHQDKHFKSMSTESISEFEKRPCYKVKLVRPDDRELIEYYDVETGLRAGYQTFLEGPHGTMQQTIAEGEYKKFGDLLFATRIIQRIDDPATGQAVEVVTTLQSVEYDTLDASAFDLPPEVKSLLDKPADDNK